jgi:hypothetical protein
MKVLFQIVKNFFIKKNITYLQKPLGRWNIDYCSKKINNKVDWSNEDHCGPCGQYILTKKEKKEKTLNDNKNR